ncbi:CyP450 monooxygenase [Trametes cingulata]|nr:CyP450 monooxygenase [Trametes cingulata]
MESASLFVPILLAGAAVLLLHIQSVLKFAKRSLGFPLPPGPRGLPLIGNMFDLPQVKPWLGYRNLRRTYGDVVQLQVPGSRLIVLSNADDALELLEKRSANTSDRTQSPITELSGLDLALGLMPYGQRWRRHRRTFWQQFHRGVLPEYYPKQRALAHRFLMKLLESPSRLKDHIRYTFSATMFKIIYGMDVQDEQDSRIALVEAAFEAIAEGIPGRFLVEMFPILRNIPAWFPGAGFQRVLAHSKAANDELKHRLFDEVKHAQEVKPSEVQSCIVTQLLARSNWSPGTALPFDEEEMLKNVAAISFSAGSDTTFSTLQAIFLALSLHPEVQKRAQAELDAVVGPHRLPEHADRGKLVYINALVKEALRWHVVLPIGVAHRTLEDDEFHGYFIPAGSDIIINVWDILHDPEVYEQPEEFRPDRFIRDGQLDNTVRDPAAFMFGFGRRICPGRYFAEDSLFINIASVLHVFDIGPPLDANGLPFKIAHEQTSGTISYPEDCRCTVKPRSAEAASLGKEAQRLHADA